MTFLIHLILFLLYVSEGIIDFFTSAVSLCALKYQATFGAVGFLVRFINSDLFVFAFWTFFISHYFMVPLFSTISITVSGVLFFRLGRGKKIMIRIFLVILFSLIKFSIFLEIQVSSSSEGNVYSSFRGCPMRAFCFSITMVSATSTLFSSLNCAAA